MKSPHKVKFEFKPDDLMSADEARKRGYIVYDPGELMKDDDELEQEDFNPDWASPPGNTMTTIMEERRWPVAEFAHKMGLTMREAADLIHAEMPISETLAEKLAAVLGLTPRFWLRREAQYRAQLRKLGRTCEDNI